MRAPVPWRRKDMKKMTDSAQHLADLKAFKAKLVEDRRAIVRKELDAVNRGGDILPSKFLEIQGEIEAVDRAIADEENIRRNVSSSKSF
jgi:hypothetical protein